MPQTKDLAQSVRTLYSNLTNPVTHWRSAPSSNETENFSPLRSELLSPDQLEQHGAHLAQSHQLAKQPRAEYLLSRLNENERVIETTYNHVTQLVHEAIRIPPAGEWLLDNFYVIKEQITLSREHLPKHYSKELPILAKGPSSGYPRIYHLATEYISHVDGRVDEENLSRFIAGYQQQVHLTIGELWAMPIMLRLALIENLRRVCERIIIMRNDTSIAAAWADKLIEMAEKDPKNLVIILADMANAEIPSTSAFVAELYRRLQGQSASLALALSWFDQRLAELGFSADQLILAESQGQASDRVSIGNSITSMRLIAAVNWKQFVEDHSVLDHILREDPAGIYSSMDFETRDSYRHVVEQIAKRTPHSQEEVAKAVVALASVAPASSRPGPQDACATKSHIGHYLAGPGLRTIERQFKCRVPRPRPPDASRRGLRLLFYLTAIALISSAVAALVAYWFSQLGAGIPLAVTMGVLLALAASQPAVQLVNLLITIFVRPRRLPRMDYSKGIPESARTIVAVPTIIGSKKVVPHLIEGLEVRYLANQDPNLFFALLTDFPDADNELTDEDSAVLASAVQGIEALNKKYAGDRANIFFLLHRPRRWNEREGVWMGHERKRGKLTEFNHVLRGSGADRFMKIVGDTELLKSMRYVITLDTDTQLPRDTARALTATHDHPLNRPIYDERRGRVVSGYGLLQPRVAINLATARKSRFVKIMAHDAGIDPYTRTVSDVYQDLFGEGSFVGKGIYDVDAFEKACGTRFPDNRILSHDLIEGCYARSGLVTDVELVEDFPSRQNVDISRRHRWMRGDWQIATWLAPFVPDGEGRLSRNTLTFLSRWKIFDNLRRTVAAPAALAVLIIAWFCLPSLALTATLVIALFPFIPVVCSALNEFPRVPRECSFRMHAGRVASNAGRGALQALLSLVFLCHEAILALDAVGRTVVKLCFTRRRMLEWITASDAEHKTATDVGGFYREMWWTLVVPAGLIVALAEFQPTALGIAAPLLIPWMFSPLLAFWLSQPLPERKVQPTPDQQLFLREVARRTWMFFDTFVNANENWLPPDNFQYSPVPLVAHRTSPTNIGVMLLSTLAAADLGYISRRTLLQRIKNTVATLEKLPRYNGHLFNWYDTISLQPLMPQYISSVDSGNLLGHLIVLRGGLAEMPSQNLMPESLAGLADTIRCLRTELLAMSRADGATVTCEPDLLKALERLGIQAHSASGDFLTLFHKLISMRADFKVISDKYSDTLMSNHAAIWARALAHHFGEICGTIEYLIPWITRTDLPAAVMNCEEYKRFITTPTLLNLKRLSTSQCVANALPQLRTELVQSGERATEMLAEINTISASLEPFMEMKFDFLYSKANKQLSIGYNVTDHRLDGSYYDLLASEARLASYVAIAQGQIPRANWFALGRKLTSAGNGAALLSWSGSMFEYLMPALVMPSYEGSLLDLTITAVVERQREYGRQHGIPWGISESGFNSRDVSQNYQYRAFGVPGLGFKRGLNEDLVVAPYATAMAVIDAPYEATLNLQRMAAMGAMNELGFFEAIDFSPARLMNNQKFAIVKSHMAHHQGMALLGLVQHLLNQPMQRRFMLDPQLKSVDLLLQERLPQALSLIYPHSAEEAHVVAAVESNLPAVRDYNTPHTAMPQVQLLSNGRYHVMISNAGGGYARWRDHAVTRWREDGTCDNWGQFVYLRDLRSNKVWSPTYQPTCVEPEDYFVRFGAGHTEFRRRDSELVSHLHICVSPEDDVEIRTLKLANTSRMMRNIEITTFAEVVINTAAADLAHPAFSNLFVQTELLPDKHAILCHRRPRSQHDSVPWMFHLITTKSNNLGTVSFETDRAKFIGRGRTARNPFALTKEGELSNSSGSVLDPAAAIRLNVSLAHAQTAEIQIVTGMAESRIAALALIDKFKDHRLCERAFEVAWTNSRVVLDQLNATEAMSQVFCDLASPLLYASPMHRAAGNVIARNTRGQSGLWGYGISGDYPIVLMRVGDKAGVALAAEALKAHAYLRMKGLAFDLVIGNEDASTYRQDLHDEMMGLVLAGSEAALLDQPGGVFIRRGDLITEEDRILLQSLARATLQEGRGTLGEQLERVGHGAPNLPRLVPTRHIHTSMFLRPDQAHPSVQFFNGWGGFSQDGREYVIHLPPDRDTPAPWCNVLANAHFGSVVTERGNAYSFAENAHEYRLTPWNNDPVTDTGGECFYIRDDESGRIWSPTPYPARGGGSYTIRHGFGYSTFETSHDGIASKLTLFVPHDAPVKLAILKLRNDSVRRRRISVTNYIEWVLGDSRQKYAMHVVTEIENRSGAIIARNAFNADFNKRLSFTALGDSGRSFTCDRNEFIGRNGSLEDPAGLTRTRLSGRVGAGMDPCTALQASFELPEEREREIVFVIGSARSVSEVQSIAQRFQTARAANESLRSLHFFWEMMLNNVHVTTPDPAVNLLVNGWLTYQVIASRYWARSGFYQSGGAYGFRDQLQDTLALIHSAPELTREHILRCAARQFPEGDVQHWWHPPIGRGVRTQFSDDYLWLPYAVAHYVKATNDTGILEEKIPFITGRPVKVPDEEAYYDLPTASTETATLYEHCLRALKRGMARNGPHNLPLMGCGDWNDGMNLVGIHGKGESVWLAFFLIEVLQRFAGVAALRQDSENEQSCHDHARKLAHAVEEHAWDGNWYLRAFFDDGTPLGSHQNEECQIDVLPQAWAVISGATDPGRARTGMAAVREHLVREKEKLIQLFDPPFEKSDLNPGYIKAYVPGVRENGGQYTHGAVWAVMAFAEMGEVDEAWKLLDMLNPIRHAQSPRAMETYRVEPYVVAADVYRLEHVSGRGGWTWYTGSAGWMYRLITETLLGIERRGTTLQIHPRLPKDWNGFELRYRYYATTYKINVIPTSGPSSIKLDGAAQPQSDAIKLVDDGREHDVELRVGSSMKPVLKDAAKLPEHSEVELSHA